MGYLRTRFQNLLIVDFNLNCYMQIRASGRGQGITNEGKKKRSEDNSETSLKRPKQESSSVSSVKVCHNVIGYVTTL